MSTAFLFAGQGAQYPGMGKDLYDHFPAARAVFERAGERIRDLCFEGTAEELKNTANTQPCVYTVTMAAYMAFMEEYEKQAGEKARPAALAGVSLEYRMIFAFALNEQFAGVGCCLTPAVSSLLFISR